MRADWTFAIAVGLFACRDTHPARSVSGSPSAQRETVDAAPAPRPAGPNDPVALARVSPDARAFCAVQADGRVRCWGDAPIGSASMDSARVVEGWTDVADVAAGERSACARLRDGRVSCFGENANGEVGDGTHLARTTPAVVAALTSVDTIAPGGRSFCATISGAVKCWGGNAFGNLGTGDMVGRDEPVAVPALDDVATVGAGGGRTCAVRHDATLQCWGFNPYSTQFFPAALSGNLTHPIPMPGIADARAVALGGEFGCVLLRTGRVACWGTNGHGQLGDGTVVSRATPVEITGLDDVLQIAAGSTRACARRSDGTVRCWGGDAREPTRVAGIVGAIDMALGADTACVLDREHRIACWTGATEPRWVH